MADTELIFHIHLSQDEFLAYYQGAARSVFARATDGRTVRFPAKYLQPFLTHQGIHGVFALSYDPETSKFKQMRKIG